MKVVISGRCVSQQPFIPTQVANDIFTVRIGDEKPCYFLFQVAKGTLYLKKNVSLIFFE